MSHSNPAVLAGASLLRAIQAVILTHSSGRLCPRACSLVGDSRSAARNGTGIAWYVLGWLFSARISNNRIGAEAVNIVGFVLYYIHPWPDLHGGQKERFWPS